MKEGEMRGRILSVVLLLVSSTLWAQASLEVSLTFSPERQVLGCPIRTTVTLRNTGTDDLSVPSGHLLATVLRFELPPNTTLLMRGYPPHDGGMKWERLGPKESRLYELNFEPHACAPGT